MKIQIGKLFFASALSMLILGLVFGLLAAITYLVPDFLKTQIGFVSLRPLHVSSAIFWILLGATGCVYSGMQELSKSSVTNKLSIIQWLLWIIAIIGIVFSYFQKDFGGREYWEFNPVWALPIAAAWLLFIFNFVSTVRKMKNWPVYIWMWLTGICFFLFTFAENYLWLFPYFRSHFVTDMTIQWKVNGSLVGAWNQILYGTAFFLMDKISKSTSTGKNKLAFAMYFLGLTNLMFNWGHHIYTLPTEKYIRYFGYAVSMTEWIFFIKIFFDWKKSLQTIQKHYHYFPYRFLMAADIWVFFNLTQAIMMSIPAINKYTHGTHVTVAHAMGTTIGINTMILFAAAFVFLNYEAPEGTKDRKLLNLVFWLFQLSLFVFWLSLNFAGIQKAIWQLSEVQIPYSKMMDSLSPYFISFTIAGFFIFLSIAIFVFKLMKTVLSTNTKRNVVYHE